MSALPSWWFSLSALAFGLASLMLLISGIVFFRTLRQTMALLDNVEGEVEQLGEMAVQTVSHAAETMQLVENRVASTMGQARQGGAEASRSAMGIGSVLAGVYMVTRLVGALRGNSGGRKAKKKPRSKWKLF